MWEEQSTIIQRTQRKNPMNRMEVGKLITCKFQQTLAKFQRLYSRDVGRPCLEVTPQQVLAETGGVFFKMYSWTHSLQLWPPLTEGGIL